MRGGAVMHVHLVMFEAWNISRFITVTNKRREIAGASELITYLDRRWVKNAVEEVFEGFDASWQIEKQPVEILETGAGTAKVLVRDQRAARRLVTCVTLQALRDAPGLEVCGVVSERFDWSVEGALHQVLGRTAQRLTPVRTSLPGPDARFLRLPIVDQCRSTGLPAQSLMPQPDRTYEPRSSESRAKWQAFGKQDDGDGLQRLAGLAGVSRPQVLGKVVGHLNDEAEWVGVVYADGNGLGTVFGAFEKCVEGGSNRSYADTLRGFSTAMQSAARDAFRAAVRELEGAGARLDDGDGPAPVLPLILGGDDMVALCSGKWALPFAEAYLREFERLTAEAAEITEALHRQGEVAALSACAGVAIVKPHFPFDAAQDLAYDLMREAKQVKTKVDGPCSALSFHVLYDSSDASLERLRDQVTFTSETVHVAEGDAPAAQQSETLLLAQPYVVGAGRQDAPWARGRHWSDLLRRVAALVERDEDGERLLPASQLHELREALFLGSEVADARFRGLLPRYEARGLLELAGGPRSLFWQEEVQGKEGLEPGRWVCGLLDALDAEGFVPVGVER